MTLETEINKNFIETSPLLKKEYLPSISVDCIVFGFHDGNLKILLARLIHSKTWSLPGGYIKKDEDLEKGASRILKERTGAEKYIS